MSKRSLNSPLARKGKRLPKVRPRGFVRVYTWHPNIQTEVTIATATIAIHTPQQVIRDASAVVPQKYLPLTIMIGMDSPCIVHLNFGAEGGVSCLADITVDVSDVPLFVNYMFAIGVKAGMVIAELQSDDGEGEELPVPTISESMLEQMKPTTEAVN